MNYTKILTALLASFVIAAALATGVAAAEGTPRAGQFCSSTVAGQTAIDAKGRTVRCQDDGERLRWTVIEGSAAPAADPVSPFTGDDYEYLSRLGDKTLMLHKNLGQEQIENGKMICQNLRGGTLSYDPSQDEWAYGSRSLNAAIDVFCPDMAAHKR